MFSAFAAPLFQQAVPSLCLLMAQLLRLTQPLLTLTLTLWWQQQLRDQYAGVDCVLTQHQLLLL